MAKVCQITGRKTQVGNNVSHANNKTKRKFYPNLQTKKFFLESEGVWVRMKVSAKAIRTINKNGFEKTLIAAAQAFGADRAAVICREMSKQYEEVVRGSFSELISWSESKDILGEITVVVSGFDPATNHVADTDLVEMVLKQEAAGESRKEAIAQVAKQSGVSKRVVFDAMVTYKSEDKI